MRTPLATTRTTAFVAPKTITSNYVRAQTTMSMKPVVKTTTTLNLKSNVGPKMNLGGNEPQIGTKVVSQPVAVFDRINSIKSQANSNI